MCKMASARRVQSVVRRNGAGAQIGEEEEDVEAFTSLKLSNSKSYMVAGGLVVSFFNSASSWMKAAVSGVLFQHPSRFRDRSGADEFLWNRAYFRIVLFFIVGAFMGLTLTPFLYVDIPKSFTPENHEIPVKVDSVVGSFLPKNDLGQKEDGMVDDKVELWNNSTIAKAESLDSDFALQKLLIVVTPTYVRPLQAYHLNRLAQTLRNVPTPLLWIVVEMFTQSDETARILRGSGVVYRHLACEKNVTNVRDRGLYQRNIALSHIENHRLDGIVHFADDSGVYSLDLFQQMRQIRRFGTWPVAMVSGSRKQVMIEGPVCNGSKVVGWYSDLDEISRRFRAEMAGFAFNSTILWEPIRWYQDAAEPIEDGLEEIAYVEQLLEDENETECLIQDHSFIKVWHLDIEAPDLFYPKGWVVKKNLKVVIPLT